MTYENSWLHFFPLDEIGTGKVLPASIVAGTGIHITDELGNRYIDGISGAYCVNVGYGRDEIVDAAARAAKRIAFSSPYSFTNPDAVKLASKLARLAEPVVGTGARVFFTNSGSEAVEVALKVSRAYWAKSHSPARKWFVSRDHSFHGVTYGALSVCGFPEMKTEFGPVLSMTATIPTASETPDVKKAILTSTPGKGEDIAAVIVETVETSNAMSAPSAEYIAGLNSFRDEYGALIIVDEVINGFGRLGHWFSAEKFGLNADILICAKGLTSGYESLGATIVSERIASEFARGDSSMFAHGATFGGRPAAAAAALANIGILEEEKLLQNSIERGSQLSHELGELQKKTNIIEEITGTALLQAMKLRLTVASGMSQDDQLANIRSRLRKNGLITTLYYNRNEPYIEIAPPLCVSEEEISEIVKIIEYSLC